MTYAQELEALIEAVVTGDISPQEAGRMYEVKFARSIGAALVPGSGNQFSKLDAKGESILFSIKWAGRHKSFRVEDEHFKEADMAINGPGGIGGQMTPALAWTTEGGEYVAFRKVDLMMLLLEGGTFATREAVDIGTTPRAKKSIEERLA